MTRTAVIFGVTLLVAVGSLSFVRAQQGDAGTGFAAAGRARIDAARVSGGGQSVPDELELGGLDCPTSDTCYAVGAQDEGPVGGNFEVAGLVLPITDGKVGTPQIVPGPAS